MGRISVVGPVFGALFHTYQSSRPNSHTTIPPQPGMDPDYRPRHVRSMIPATTRSTPDPVSRDITERGDTMDHPIYVPPDTPPIPIQVSQTTPETLPPLQRHLRGDDDTPMTPVSLHTLGDSPGGTTDFSNSYEGGSGSVRGESRHLSQHLLQKKRIVTANMNNCLCVSEKLY